MISKNIITIFICRSHICHSNNSCILCFPVKQSPVTDIFGACVSHKPCVLCIGSVLDRHYCFRCLIVRVFCTSIKLKKYS